MPKSKKTQKKAQRQATIGDLVWTTIYILTAAGMIAILGCDPQVVS